MTKYFALLNILDVIIKEADVAYSSKYNLLETDPEKINQARARAFIHLYLKVSFGLLEFRQREYFLTDGAYDGGVDGYYINKENKTIYFIQSKFRTTQKNFENKEISLDEILVMDINRILEGEDYDEHGNAYNGKIKQLKRDILNVEDIARYKYQVILLANLSGIQPSKLRNLTGGYLAEVINHEKCYSNLIFPVISGTFFNASDLNIHFDLSNKSAGSKISYTVQTKNSECEITVLFIPTIEIAKILLKYKNSILKYNPRSYLELEGQKVNSSIRQTIMQVTTNEFALYNNGITMISDETYINEKIGQKNKAQLTVKNPQIINGGQTSFTLSRIYEENIENADKIFENKEVLLKIITLVTPDGGSNDLAKKMELIEEVSTATNQQTPVNTADRFSNDSLHIEIQKMIFSRYGLLYERKRGEFGDGLHNGYIKADQVIERNLFFRIYNASNGRINKAVEKKLFLNSTFTIEMLDDGEKMNNFYFGYLCFKRLYNYKNPSAKVEKNIYGMVYAMTRRFKPVTLDEYEESVLTNLGQFKEDWKQFVLTIRASNKGHLKTFIDQKTNSRVRFFSESKWYASHFFEDDVITYVDSFLDGTFTPVSTTDPNAQFVLFPTDFISNTNLEKQVTRLQKNMEYLERLHNKSYELRIKFQDSQTNEEKKEYADQILQNSVQITRMEDSIMRRQLVIKDLESKI